MLRLLSLLLSLPLAAMAAAPAEATIFADAQVRELMGFSNTTLCGGGGVGVGASDAECSEVGAYDGEGHATADYGSLGTYAELVYTGDLPFPNDDFQAYGRAYWSDRLTLSSPLLQPGALTDARMIFGLTGTGQRTPPDFFDGGNLFVDTSFRVAINGLEVNPNSGEFTGPGTYVYDFDFTNGGSVLVRVELISDVRCFSCGGPYRGLSDYLSTAVLEQVQVADLAPGDFTVSSAEGESYANVVPEPGSLLLVVVGLVFGFGVGRRRG